VGRFKRGFSGWLVILGLLGGVAAHAEAPVWAIKGAKNTVYLAGSVHLLRASDAKLPAAFDKAYADSAEVEMAMVQGRVTYSTPDTLTEIIWSQSARSASAAGPIRINPALLTTVSSRPSSATTEFTAAAACC